MEIRTKIVWLNELLDSMIKESLKRDNVNEKEELTTKILHLSFKIGDMNQKLC
jgi:hypothetical protein